MKNQPPSIFNDVIGPVMRGPSSSHCAAAARIGLLARALMDSTIASVLVEFDTSGSLATTHASQGSDMGLCAGLLGFEPSDERLVHYRKEIQKAGLRIQFETGTYGDEHPNTYRLHLKSAKETHALIALSTGGGMIEVVDIDGHAVSMLGDLYETLVYFKKNETVVIRNISRVLKDKREIQVLKGQDKEKNFIRIKTRDPLDDAQIAAISAGDETISVKILPPVLPILTPADMMLPFESCDQMLAFNRSRRLPLWELAILYERARGGLHRKEVMEKMIAIVRTMKYSLETGLAGTRHEDRILGCQSILYRQKQAAGQLLDLGILNRIILYITAFMEVKSALGVIVAAPTAGSCGGLPGTVIGAAEAMDLPETDMAESMLAAGMIGVFISTFSTFAAESAGCQAECGSGSGMAAAALVTLMGGTTETAVAAASMALQNSLGMICDPVANRVEVPCLGKNVMAASNALACANMALAGFDPVIPLDEVIQTMDAVGKQIPCELRCTCLGGLSVTKTSQKIKEKLSCFTTQ